MSHLVGLHAYTPGLQPQEEGWIKLNTNENPYPPSPHVREAVLRELGEDGARLRLYPDPLSWALREEVARQNGLETQQVLMGNGSDEILKYICLAYADAEHPVAMVEPSYSLYPVLAAARGCEMKRVELDASIALPVEALCACGAKVLFITQPNAPTGVAFPMAALRELVAGTEALVVFDEAYVAFAEESAVELVREFDNVVVTRTFSKSYGLAGLRVGFLMGPAAVVEVLDKVRDAYNLDRLAQVAAFAALRDQAYYKGVTQQIKATRERFRMNLEARGWSVRPSASNFVLVEPRLANGERGTEVARGLYEYFLSQKILVRHFPDHPLTCACLRISIGLPEEMEALNKAIELWMNQLNV